MTAKQLIKRLLKVDPDTRVFIHGFQGGFDDPELTEVEDYKLNVSTHIYIGPHVKASKSEIESGEKIVKGVSLI